MMPGGNDNDRLINAIFSGHLGQRRVAAVRGLGLRRRAIVMLPTGSGLQRCLDTEEASANA